MRSEEQAVRWTGSRPGPARKASLASGAGMTFLPHRHPVQACGAPRRGPKAREPCTARANSCSAIMPRLVGGAIEDLARAFVEQVDPLGVHAFDQADLPQSPPFL